MATRGGSSKILFDIPQGAEAALKQFQELPELQFEMFVSALNETGPKLRTAELAEVVAPKVGMSVGDAEGLLALLAGLHAAFSFEQRDATTFVDDFCNALSEKDDPALLPADWNLFRARLTKVLGEERSLGITAKAIDVMTDASGRMGVHDPVQVAEALVSVAKNDYSGSAKAIQASPDFVPILPLPQAMTMYWRPLTA